MCPLIPVHVGNPNPYAIFRRHGSQYSLKSLTKIEYSFAKVTWVYYTFLVGVFFAKINKQNFPEAQNVGSLNA